MICVTVVIRFAWLYQAQPKLVVDTSSSSLIACLKVLLKPKWSEDEIEDYDVEDPKKNLTTLIDNYNATGQFVAPLHGIFQQWFVIQWVVYFIKIIEDFTVIINSFLNEDDRNTAEHDEHELLFVITHLVYDLLTLFLIPYYCASLMNLYHDEYHKRLKIAQNNIPSKDCCGWRLQCALLITSLYHHSVALAFH